MTSYQCLHWQTRYVGSWQLLVSSINAIDWTQFGLQLTKAAIQRRSTETSHSYPVACFNTEQLFLFAWYWLARVIGKHHKGQREHELILNDVRDTRVFQSFARSLYFTSYHGHIDVMYVVTEVRFVDRNKIRNIPKRNVAFIWAGRSPLFCFGGNSFSLGCMQFITMIRVEAAIGKLVWIKKDIGNEAILLILHCIILFDTCCDHKNPTNRLINGRVELGKMTSWAPGLRAYHL